MDDVKLFFDLLTNDLFWFGGHGLKILAGHI